MNIEKLEKIVSNQTAFIDSNVFIDPGFDINVLTFLKNHHDIREIPAGFLENHIHSLNSLLKLTKNSNFFVVPKVIQSLKDTLNYLREEIKFYGAKMRRDLKKEREKFSERSFEIYSLLRDYANSFNTLVRKLRHKKYSPIEKPYFKPFNRLFEYFEECGTIPKKSRDYSIGEEQEEFKESRRDLELAAYSLYNSLIQKTPTMIISNSKGFPKLLACGINELARGESSDLSSLLLSAFIINPIKVYEARNDKVLFDSADYVFQKITKKRMRQQIR